MTEFSFALSAVAALSLPSLVFLVSFSALTPCLLGVHGSKALFTLCKEHCPFFLSLVCLASASPPSLVPLTLLPLVSIVHRSLLLTLAWPVRLLARAQALPHPHFIHPCSQGPQSSDSHPRSGPSPCPPLPIPIQGKARQGMAQLLQRRPQMQVPDVPLAPPPPGSLPSPSPVVHFVPPSFPRGPSLYLSYFSQPPSKPSCAWPSVFYLLAPSLSCCFPLPSLQSSLHFSISISQLPRLPCGRIAIPPPLSNNNNNNNNRPLLRLFFYPICFTPVRAFLT